MLFQIELGKNLIEILAILLNDLLLEKGILFEMLFVFIQNKSAE